MWLLSPPINTVLIASESCLKTPCYHASTPYYMFICLHIPLSAIMRNDAKHTRLAWQAWSKRRGRESRTAATLIGRPKKGSAISLSCTNTRTPTTPVRCTTHSHSTHPPLAPSTPSPSLPSPSACLLRPRPDHPRLQSWKTRARRDSWTPLGVAATSTCFSPRAA